MADWTPILRPAEIAEQRLLEAMLAGRFAINSSLPGERDLAEQIGVTRPTLREALQRLARPLKMAGHPVSRKEVSWDTS